MTPKVQATKAKISKWNYIKVKGFWGFPGGAAVKNLPAGASLVAQWLRICLLMQGTRVRALAWEDPTCRRAAGPVSHNC